MKAVILAAGSGSRLGAAAEGLPKALLPVGGQALIDRQLDGLAKAGIRDITVVAGYQADRLVTHLGGRCRVVVNEHYATTNSIVSLQRAADQVRGDDFLVQNGDVLYSPDLVRRMVAARWPNACLVDPFRPWSDREYQVEVSDGQVVRYSREVPEGRSVGESAQLVRVGAADSHAFLGRIEAILSAGGHHHFPNLAYECLIKGTGLWPVFTAGLPWWEIDTPEDYANCQAAVASEAGIPAPPRLGATLRSVLREPRIPYRLGLIPPLVGAMARHPVRAGRNALAVWQGRLSVDGLHLQSDGPEVLSLVLSDAHGLGLEPMLLWGTLLGWVRGGGLIWNDHDLDLGVLPQAAARLPALRDSLRRRGFQVRIENPFKLSLVHPRYPRLYVDFDVVHPWKDGWAITNIDSDPCRIFRYRFDRSVFETTRSARFAGLEVLVPAHAEGFLSAVYGDWSLPARQTHYLYRPLNVEVALREHS